MTEARQEAGRRDGAERTRRPGTPCGVSLKARGTTATREFYQGLFGWEFRPDRAGGTRVRAFADGEAVADISTLTGHHRSSPAWTLYLATDAADLTADLVRHCGGTVAVGPLAADGGRRALVADPGGAVFGLCQGAARPGFAGTGAPGTPVWSELVTHQARHVTPFYQCVFGLAATHAAAGRWTVSRDGVPVAGLVEADPDRLTGRGAHWLAHFAVADLDAAVRRAHALGGRSLTPPSGGDGPRSAVLSDPGGAVFAVREDG
ncbi:VOC family protein [Streptomyces sp. NPDC049906]|uniref:VOC family protein n=1 Tax=Streptomyces sp. NPDC049906 TaxID=3155656 RepID=UPI00342430E1